MGQSLIDCTWIKETRKNKSATPLLHLPVGLSITLDHLNNIHFTYHVHNIQSYQGASLVTKIIFCWSHLVKLCVLKSLLVTWGFITHKFFVDGFFLCFHISFVCAYCCVDFVCVFWAWILVICKWIVFWIIKNVI
jgi:hypothetical protein